MTGTQKQRSAIAEIGAAAQHGFVYGIGTVVTKILSFAMLPFYTHRLTPADYGTLEILDLSMAILGMIVNMGMTPAFLRHFGSAKDERERNTTVSTAFLFAVASGAFIFFVCLPLIPPLSRALVGAQTPSRYLLLSFSTLVLGYIANPVRAYLRAIEASSGFAVIELCCTLAMLSLNVYFIAVLNMGLLGILLSSVIVYSVQVLLLAVWLVRRVGSAFKVALVHSMLRFGAPLIFAQFSIFVLNFSDRFFLQRFRSLDEVGIYAVGYKFGFMINYLMVQPFSAMWEPRMYVVHRRPDHAGIMGQIFTFYAAALTFGALAISVFSPEIAHVMVGGRFASSSEVIPFVAFSYVFWGLGYYLTTGMLLARKTGSIGGIGAAAACLNLVLNYLLIPYAGMKGAAWVTCLSFAFIAATTYVQAQRVYTLPFAIGRVTGIIGAAALLYIATVLVRFDAVMMNLGFKCLAIAVFPIVLWHTGLISSGEAESLRLAKEHVARRVASLAASFGKRAVESA
jgi:O-antigen/teichoic acid export membrane protein